MKHKLLWLTSLLFLAVCAKGQSFYDLPVKDIVGNPLSLGTYANKKIMFILAPLQQTDSAFVQLLAFRQSHGDSVQIIAIPSMENGFQLSLAGSLQLLYQPLGIVLTEPMYTKKDSQGQSALLQWLTDKDRNTHFSMDSKGIGTKFFVSGTGELYAVLVPETSLSSAFVTQIINRVAPASTDAQQGTQTNTINQ